MNRWAPILVRPEAAAAPAVVALLGLALGCDGRPGGDRPLAVVLSGDMAGWIVPCGCAANQSGGLPRRGSYVAAARGQGHMVPADVVLADVGGAPGGSSPYDLLRFEAALRGAAAMGIAAHNLGGPELALGPDQLDRLARETGVVWLSANARRRDGREIGRPWVPVEAGGRRVVLLGVVGAEYATPEIEVLPPRQALLDALRDAAPHDTLVVLAYLGEDELHQLAETLPEADLLVGGPTGQPIAPRRVGAVLMASATNQGKFLARFDAAPGERRFAGRIDELDGTYADDPEQTANLRRFYAELQRRDVAAAETSFAPRLPAELPPGFAVAGTSRCRECHVEDYDVWKASAHAHAWESLAASGAHVDPACQRCHTTGYGLPGGFESLGRGAERRQVGCESCHGPSLAHADDPRQRTAHFAQASGHCVACHDRENSPEFQYDAYWKRIEHGKSPEVEP